MMRNDFPSGIKDVLAKRAGMRCSNPGCCKATSGPRENPTKAVNIGVAAHITAAALGGPRYDKNMAPDHRRSIENGIWLCQNCAKLVDNDPKRYEVVVLTEWKFQAEEAARKAIEASPQKDRTSGWSAQLKRVKVTRSDGGRHSPSPDGILESYLAHVLNSTRYWRIVERILGHDIDIQTIYVERQIEKGRLEKLPAAEFLRRIQEDAYERRRFCITSLPGMGKTTLWRQLGRWVARQENDWVPLMVSAGSELARIVPVEDVPSKLHMKLPSLLDCVLDPDVWDSLERREMKEVLMERLSKGLCLLLVDAFDEIPASSRGTVIDWIRKWMDRYPRMSVVVFSRPHPAEEGHLNGLLGLQLWGFDDEAAHEFVCKWFSDAPVHRDFLIGLKAARSNERMGLIFRNPLYLTFLCALLEQWRCEDLKDRPEEVKHSLRRESLFPGVIDLMLQDLDKSRGIRAHYAKEAKQFLLERLGFECLEHGRTEFRWAEMVDLAEDLWPSLAPEADPGIDEKDFHVRGFLEEIISRSGLLVPKRRYANKDNDLYGFSHHAFAEWFHSQANIRSALTDPESPYMRRKRKKEDT